MTLNEIKIELQNKIAQLQSVSLDLQDSGELAICFTILSRLNDLKAPPLQWRQINESEWVAFLIPNFKYNIELIDGVYIPYDYEGYSIEKEFGAFEDLSDAQHYAQKHWDILYQQMIKL